MKLDQSEDLAMMKRERDRAIAALPTSQHQLLKERKVRDDEVTLVKAALKEQKTKFRTQLADQSLQIQQLELDLRGDSSSSSLQRA